jgi:hypothetical protein
VASFQGTRQLDVAAKISWRRSWELPSFRASRGSVGGLAVAIAQSSHLARHSDRQARSEGPDGQGGVGIAGLDVFLLRMPLNWTVGFRSPTES